MLKKIGIKNFKSFKDFKIELDKFNCIIASNNAGKSNLIYAFNFLQYAIVNVKNAIEEFGGFNNLKNIFLEKNYIEFDLLFFEKEYFRAGVSSNDEFIEIFKNLEINLNLKIFKNGNWKKRYKIKGRFGKKSNNLPLEKFNIYFELFQKEARKIKTYPFEIEILYTNEVEKNSDYEELYKLPNEVIKKEIIKIDTKNKEDLLYTLNLQNLIDKNFSIFSGNSDLLNLDEYFYTYSFYPEIIKTTLKGGMDLRVDGCNLVEVLNFTKKYFTHNFENIADSLIGIVEELNDIKIDKDLIDRNTLLLKEKNKFLPFNIVSDGTINLLAILTAIYGASIGKKMISFDEIEKHLHLSAIDYILEILKSQNFQATFTTQSTEIINNLDLKNDNLIFLYRDYDGFTKGINANKIPNFNKKVKRYKDISTIIRNEVLGYLGDFDEE